jgi:hypothetical protein
VGRRPGATPLENMDLQVIVLLVAALLIAVALDCRDGNTSGADHLKLR